MFKNEIINELKKYFEVKNFLNDSDGTSDIFDLAFKVAVSIIGGYCELCSSDAMFVIEDIAMGMQEDMVEEIKDILKSNNVFKCMSFEFEDDYYCFYYISEVEFSTPEEFDNHFNLCIFLN